MVACGAEPADEHIEDAPCLVVEVLSPSTARVDRREKRLIYQQIPTIRSYVVVGQQRRVVDWYARGDDDAWAHAALVQRGEIAIDCPGLTLSLDEIYDGVELPPASQVREGGEE